MGKTANLNIRIDPNTKDQAEKLFSNFGLTVSDAVNMFIHQSIIYGGIPFAVKMDTPNAVTLAAMQEADEIAKSSKGYDNVEDMLRELKS